MCYSMFWNIRCLIRALGAFLAKRGCRFKEIAGNSSAILISVIVQVVGQVGFLEEFHRAWGEGASDDWVFGGGGVVWGAILKRITHLQNRFRNLIIGQVVGLFVYYRLNRVGSLIGVKPKLQ